MDAKWFQPRELDANFDREIMSAHEGLGDSKPDACICNVVNYPSPYSRKRSTDLTITVPMIEQGSVFLQLGLEHALAC